MAGTEGERRVVAVLMADIAGSTAIGEALGPERSKYLFDEVMRLIAAEVERYDGTVAQLAGDGLLALFGAPAAHEDDSERAVRAGLAVQRALERYGADVREAYDIDIRARIAVNTGPVVIAPDDGDGDARGRYNALGDTVNVTARLQALAAEGEVLLGPQTAVQVRSSFELEELGRTSLRGRAEPIDRYRVVGELEPGPTAQEGALVGRDAELAEVRDALERLADGIGAILAITGEAGIGKSRLVAEAAAPLGDRLLVLEGRGLSYAQAFPYGPVRELLRDWLGAGATTSEARVRLDLKAAVQPLFPDPDEVYPFLAGLLGLTPDAQTAARLREFSPETVHKRSVHAVADLACALARERPVLLVFEDLHWADEPTLDLIGELLELTERDPVGIALLYRADRDAGSWGVGERARQRYPHLYRELELRPLAPDSTRALVRELADGDVPEPVAALISERSGGNPLFAAEALRDVVERGSMWHGESGWELAVDPDSLEVPLLVQGVLQARLDRLEPGAREVTAVASVIGRRFAVPLLERVVDNGGLASALTDLQRLELIVEERRRPHPEYRFRHGLVQEAAYAMLTDTRRRELHGRVAAALEVLAGDDPSPRTFAHLARHYTAADDGAKAAEYLIRAGDEARGISADPEAIQHYRRAREFLSRLGDDRRSRETLFKIALVHHLAFDFAGAERAYDEAFACKVEPLSQPELCERLTAAVIRPGPIAPGLTYVSDTSALVQHLFRGLLIVDRDLNVMPSLAENFRVSADGTTYLFQLYDDARWSDGEPLTAHDFVYTWERVRGLSASTAFLFADMESATALDDHTLEVVLREPRNYFPYVLATTPAYPWPRHVCEGAGDTWHERVPLVSSGPFVLTSRDDEGMMLESNPNWRGARGNLSEIAIRFRERTDDFEELWRDGDIDVLPAARSAFTEIGDGCVEAAPVLGATIVGLRTDRPAVSDLRVRRAIAAAVAEVATHAEAAGSGARPPGRGGLLPPAMPGHNYALTSPASLDEAAALLADVGHPGGEGLPTLEMIATGGTVQQAEALAEVLGRLGVKVAITLTDPDIVLSGHDCDVWVCTWFADFPDPEGFFGGLVGDPTDPIVNDAETFALLDQARASRDRDERLRLYSAVDRRIVADEVLMLPVAYSRATLLRRPWVQGVWANALTPLRLDEAVVERAADPAAHAGVASSV
jgi:ABC-type transport system substrate-binding protein/class 3 adenylate cyclase